MVWIKPVIHGRHFGGYTDLVMICVHFMLIFKVKTRLMRKIGPVFRTKMGPYGPIRAHMGA